MCVAQLDNSKCNAGELCTAAGCEVQNTPCQSAQDCDDGVFCNGQETCNGQNKCASGPKPTCNDSVGCTVDSCDPGLDECVHVERDAACDDGDVCNGEFACDAQQGCVQIAAALSCGNADNKSCTTPGCHPVSGCYETPINSNCDDSSFCNGQEICDPATGAAGTGCKAGNAVVCPADAFSCTTAQCNEAVDQCTQIPHDELCVTGTCSGSTCTCAPGSQQKSCVVGAGCVQDCQTATCGNKTGACGDCKDNDGDCKVDCRRRALHRCLHLQRTGERLRRTASGRQRQLRTGLLLRLEPGA